MKGQPETGVAEHAAKFLGRGFAARPRERSPLQSPRQQAPGEPTVYQPGAGVARLPDSVGHPPLRGPRARHARGAEVRLHRLAVHPERARRGGPSRARVPDGRFDDRRRRCTSASPRPRRCVQGPPGRPAELRRSSAGHFLVGSVPRCEENSPSVPRSVAHAPDGVTRKTSNSLNFIGMHGGSNAGSLRMGKDAVRWVTRTPRRRPTRRQSVVGRRPRSSGRGPYLLFAAVALLAPVSPSGVRRGHDLEASLRSCGVPPAMALRGSGPSRTRFLVDGPHAFAGRC